MHKSIVNPTDRQQSVIFVLVAHPAHPDRHVTHTHNVCVSLCGAVCINMVWNADVPVPLAGADALPRGPRRRGWRGGVGVGSAWLPGLRPVEKQAGQRNQGYSWTH